MLAVSFVPNPDDEASFPTSQCRVRSIMVQKNTTNFPNKAIQEYIMKSQGQAGMNNSF